MEEGPSLPKQTMKSKRSLLHQYTQYKSTRDMKTQRNISLPKEQNFFFSNSTKEIDIFKLTYKEVKIIALRKSGNFKRFQRGNLKIKKPIHEQNKKFI
jgi:hypothetical protein